MAFAIVQAAQNSSASGSSLITTITATTLNNLVVVGVKVAAAAPVTSITVADSAGNTYASAVAMVTYAGNSSRFQMFYGVQKFAGATTVTATLNSGSHSGIRVEADEYSGAASTNSQAFNAVATTTGLITSGPTAVALSPSAADKLIVAHMGIGGATSITIGTGYSLTSISGTSIASGYRLTDATTSETAPFSFTGSSVSWAEIAVAFNGPLLAGDAQTLTTLGVQ